ncbi:DUF3889 domain-containing protein [Ornithinibacillus bavariensis]|uniref:DUF3889 domain-containing protein n=1 Tax=Ornithinibacillus bavariensis TaxID=545502 RepID=UPI000ED0DD54|nr:hypothetical protein [Ornithinibacillus sp.]
MKQLIKLLLSTYLCFGIFTMEQTTDHVYAQKEVPSYAKWGRIAMEKTKERFPNAEIVDYLHIGREKGVDTSTETFKLWLEEPKKEFGVFVDITFNNLTEEIIRIKFREVSS